MPMVVVVLSHSVSFSSATPWTVSAPGSSVHGPLQTRILERAAISSSRGIFLTKGWNPYLLTGRWFLYYSATWEAPDKPINFTIPWHWFQSSKIKTTSSRLCLAIGVLITTQEGDKNQTVIFFLNTYILLKYNWLTVFQGHSDNTYAYMFFQLFSIIGRHKILTIVPCAI